MVGSIISREGLGVEVDIKGIAEKGFVNLGNLYRIEKVMKKALAGESITVGMIGGSITQGALSSRPETCYAYLVYKWWVETFKDCSVKYVNGGIGGTTSQFGVARVESDMLKYDPDFVIVEYSVNDSQTDLFQETYEGLVRKILLHTNNTALLILNNVQYNDGVNAQEIHNVIGRGYHLPIVSIKDSIYTEVKEGRINASDLTPDDLHPNDLGHRMVADVVIYALEKIYNIVVDHDVDKDVVDKNYVLPEQTITKNRYIDSLRYNNKNINPEMIGFEVDDVIQENITDTFRNGWKGKKVGDSIHFEANGGMISVQYRKTIKRIAPKAIAIIDGNMENAIELDGNFEQSWGDCLYLQDLLVDGENKRHSLDIIITDVDNESDLEFYLVSVIVACR